MRIYWSRSEKKHRTSSARKKIDVLCKHLSIAASTQSHVQKTLLNPAIRDFEDELEYYAAIENKCRCIVTEDKDDFYFSEIEVLDSQQFFKKYMVK